MLKAIPSLATPSTANCGVSFANPNYLSVLANYDLTRGGTLFNFTGHTDVKELALYAQDQITTGPWLFNIGLRGDVYNGLTTASQIEPRLGASYKIKRTMHDLAHIVCAHAGNAVQAKT